MIGLTFISNPLKDRQMIDPIIYLFRTALKKMKPEENKLSKTGLKYVKYYDNIANLF